MNLVCEALGGTVRPTPAREYGRAIAASSTRAEPIFMRCRPLTTVWMSHGDQVHDAGARRSSACANVQLPGSARRVARQPRRRRGPDAVHDRPDARYGDAAFR